MIVIKLQGGLGNQMFQYAFAKSIENIFGQAVYFDISFKQVSIETPRQFALEHFKASDSILKAEVKDLPLVFRHPPGDLLKRVFGFLRTKGWFNNRWEHITRIDFHFSDLKEGSQKNLYFEGYWQSEKYFHHIRPALLADFSLKNYSAKFEIMAQKIISVNSVSIHVRHGDYLTNAVTNAFHGLCSPEYYQQAVNLIQGKVEDPTFYIFTDDIDWAKQYFTNMGLVFELVSGQGFTDQEELVLMSKCHYQIIANSSFSWWGAWLNQHEGKTVIAPQKWNAIVDNNLLSQDLLPRNWIRL